MLSRRNVACEGTCPLERNEFSSLTRRSTDSDGCIPWLTCIDDITAAFNRLELSAAFKLPGFVLPPLPLLHGASDIPTGRDPADPAPDDDRDRGVDELSGDCSPLCPRDEYLGVPGGELKGPLPETQFSSTSMLLSNARSIVLGSIK